MQVFSQLELWPPWLVQRKGRALDNMPGTADVSSDGVSEVWDVVVCLMGLSALKGSRRQRERCSSDSGGNVLGPLLEYLQHGMERERMSLSPKRRREGPRS